MKKLLNRRQLVSFISALGLATVVGFAPASGFAAGAGEPVGQVNMEKVLAVSHDKDKVEGDVNAPVTIVEYASLSCGHCADFYVKTLPEIRKKYIETGKAKLIFREIAGDVWAQAGFMLARCQPESRYFPMVQVLFEQQQNWLGNGGELQRIAKLAGVNKDGFKACMSNQEAMNEIKASTDGARSLNVLYTPTFFINGDKYEGAMSVEDMSKAIDKHL